MRLIGRLARACVFLAVCTSGPLSAQDTVTVMAGERYRAGGLQRLFAGTGYRDAWTTPVRVEVLDLGRMGGGLTPTEEGGGNATESLRFRGADGLEYVFRSVDKLAERGLPEDLHGSFLADITQDLTSAKHPAAALALPPILEALGILHVVPALYVMPDDPRLGQFREKYRGRLGQVELRLENDLAAEMFPGADDMESTDDFLDEMEEDPRNRIAAAEYLKARLVDVWIGDWDRHPDQWRWVRFDQGDARVWRPVPRDRDNAFVRYEGLVMMLARTQRPNLMRFTDRVGPIYPYHHHAYETDRKLLVGLTRAEWDSVTQWVQARLTDEVIDRALGRLPEEYRRLDAAMLRENLVARRGQLPAAGAALYGEVVGDAEVHGTDEVENARVTRGADGSLTVELASGGHRWRRTFIPSETREVRLYLHGGDDRLEVDGPPVGDILLRVIGGGGDDVLTEVSPSGGPANTRYYDDRGDNRIAPGRGKADTREWDNPDIVPLGGSPRDPRDYGRSSSLITPHLRWQANVGPVVGVGPSRTVYGFRRFPYASFWHLRGVYAPLAPHGYGAELWGVVRSIGSPRHLTVSLRGNRFESWRFHGFGNDPPRGESLNDAIVRHDFVGGEVLLHDSLGGGWSLALGPTAAWRSAEVGPGSTVEFGVPGADAHTQGGARLRLTMDRRDTLAVTRRGGGWTAEALGAAWTDGTPFGRVMGESRLYLPLLAGGPSLALRAGAEHVVGDFPFQEAAMLGGGQRLRGYDVGRFLGESAFWGTAELRQPLGQTRILVRGRPGLIVFGDVGAVAVDGEVDGSEHFGYGGGFWFETIGQVASLVYAYGDGGRLYFTLGLPF